MAVDIDGSRFVFFFFFGRKGDVIVLDLRCGFIFMVK